MAFVGSTLPLARWSADHVHDWLVGEGFVSHAAVFHRQHVDGQTLAALQFKDLAEELDIVGMAEQNQLWTAIQALRARDLRIHAPHLLPNSPIPLAPTSPTYYSTTVTTTTFLGPQTSSPRLEKPADMYGGGHTAELEELDSWLGIGQKAPAPGRLHTALDSPALLPLTSSESGTLQGVPFNSPAASPRPAPITQLDLLWGRQPPGYPMLSQAMQGDPARLLEAQLRDLKREAAALTKMIEDAELQETTDTHKQTPAAATLTASSGQVQTAFTNSTYNPHSPTGRSFHPASSPGLSPSSPAAKPTQHTYYSTTQVTYHTEPRPGLASPTQTMEKPFSGSRPTSRAAPVQPGSPVATYTFSRHQSTVLSHAAPQPGTLDEALDDVARSYDPRTRQLQKRVNYHELVRRQSVEVDRNLGF